MDRSPYVLLKTYADLSLLKWPHKPRGLASLL